MEPLIIDCLDCRGNEIEKEGCQTCFGTGIRDLTDELEKSKARYNSGVTLTKWIFGISVGIVLLLILAEAGLLAIVAGFVGLVINVAALEVTADYEKARNKIAREYHLHEMSRDYVKRKNSDSARLRLSDDGEIIEVEDDNPDSIDRKSRNRR